MSWLGELVRGLASAVLGWWQGQADKPNVIKTAETPPEKLKDWQDSIEEFKARKDAEEKAKGTK